MLLFLIIAFVYSMIEFFNYIDGGVKNIFIYKLYSLSIYTYYWLQYKLTNKVPHELFDQIKYWKKEDALNIKNNSYFYKYITHDFNLIVTKKPYEDKKYKKFDLLKCMSFPNFTNKSYDIRMDKIEQQALKNPDSHYSNFLLEFQEEMNNALTDKYEELEKQNFEKSEKNNKFNREEVREIFNTTKDKFNNRETKNTEWGKVVS